MSGYAFMTEWVFDVPRERVWRLLDDPERWPFAWDGLLDIAGFELEGMTLHRYTWRAPGGYGLRLDSLTTAREPGAWVEGITWGELEGVGTWELEDVDAGTRVRYHWHVATNKAWMRLVAPLARPFFVANHDALMHAGGRGWARLLGARLVSERHLSDDEARALRPPPRPETLAAQARHAGRALTPSTALGDALAGQRGDWASLQRWRDLVFLHWRLEASTLRGRLPAGLEPESIAGSAWVSLVCMRTLDLRLANGLPVMVGSFAQINARTYVRHEGHPGVVFLHVDCASRPICLLARSAGLPYRRASVRSTRALDELHYRSRGIGAIELRAKPAPLADTAPGPDTWQRALVERYCSFHTREGQLIRADLHHAPWHTVAVDVDIQTNEMLAALDLGPLDPRRPDLARLSPGASAVFWQPQ